MTHSFAPELILDEHQRRELAITVSQPGFKVMQELFFSAVGTFTLAMINSPEDSQETLSKHRSAKVAAQLYSQFIARVNQEVEQYLKLPRATDKPVDIAAILDMGETADIEAEEPF